MVGGIRPRIRPTRSIYPRRMPEPIIVPRENTTFSALCDRCINEKNSPLTPERAWSEGEGYRDVTVSGDLPLDQDEAWVTCPYGHEHLALREGSQRARNFGYASPHLTPKDEARVAEIRAWFHERGYELHVHVQDGRWRAPYMPYDTRIGAAEYGIGNSAVEAVENAKETYEATHTVTATATLPIENTGGVTSKPTLGGTVEIKQAVEMDTALPIDSVGGKPALDKAVEKLAGFGWNLWFVEEPDGGGFTGYLRDDKSGEVLKARIGTDFHDAWLELGLDTLPPSQEIRRKQQG
jgi:hypothetical protein